MVRKKKIVGTSGPKLATKPTYVVAHAATSTPKEARAAMKYTFISTNPATLTRIEACVAMRHIFVAANPVMSTQIKARVAMKHTFVVENPATSSDNSTSGLILPMLLSREVLPRQQRISHTGKIWRYLMLLSQQVLPRQQVSLQTPRRSTTKKLVTEAYILATDSKDLTRKAAKVTKKPLQAKKIPKIQKRPFPAQIS